jgi:hypothetical protein
MANLLRLNSLIGLTRPQLRIAIVDQMKVQREFLKMQRLRRHDIILALGDIIDSNLSNIDNYPEFANKRIKEAFNSFVADGMKWQGKGLSNNLDRCVNVIAYQCIHTMMLTEIMLDDTVLLADHTTIPLHLLVHEICEDVGALAKEKFGVAPAVEIKGELTLVNSMPSLYEYVIVELLKNSIKSVMDKYGALHVEDVDAVLSMNLVNSPDGSSGTAQRLLSIQDKGNGMSPAVLSRCV